VKLIEFKENNTTFAKDQKQYNPLPAYRYGNDSEGRIVCCWRLTFRERMRVLMFGVIWHHILTFYRPLQPQLLSIDKPEMPVRAETPASQFEPTTGLKGVYVAAGCIAFVAILMLAVILLLAFSLHR
jgi:hypothetical protein